MTERNLEQIKNDFENGKDPTLLMSEMEKTFNIPAKNDETYNAANAEIIELYRKIAASRNI